MRAALHAHILVFFKPRELPKNYKQIPAIVRTVPGHEPKQRPRDSVVPPLHEKQEDHVYQAHHVGQMVAEMVRPNVRGPNWGGYDVDQLRIAGLARAVQTRLPYLHPCNPVYCLKDRTACRFFFPWPYHWKIVGLNSFQPVSEHAHGGKRNCSTSSSGTSRTSAFVRTRSVLPCNVACLRMTRLWSRTICT